MIDKETDKDIDKEKMANVKLYTLEDCPNCKLLKQLLNNEKIKFIEVDIASPASMADLFANNVYTRTAPVLQINDKFYHNIQLPKQAIEIFKIHRLI